MKKPLILYYDDTCNFCRCFVAFVQQRNISRSITTVPIANTPLEKKQIREYGCIYSMIASIGGEQYEQDVAVIHTLARLHGPWPLMAILLRMVPRYVRQKGYMWVARNRHRILKNQ